MLRFIMSFPVLLLLLCRFLLKEVEKKVRVVAVVAYHVGLGLAGLFAVEADHISFCSALDRRSFILEPVDKKKILSI